MSIRVFLAISLNSEICEALDQFQDHAASILTVKWVRPDSMHLTVKFLGDIEPGHVAVLQEALREVVEDTAQFSLRIKGIGGFPSLQRPRVLWAGVFGEVDHLEVLVSCVESALSPLGYAQESRPYHPHLTLSRIKSNTREIGRIIESSDLLKQEWVFGNVIVDRLCLFQSRLTSHGAIYSLLCELPFGKKNV
ncbi:MAG: RNA 2',3'-cyclic phosphodiesterase [Nitrospirales bacterium]|nr:MAG: RNA 2',3'-cyclic phosphodiesterase [Nitrospirales bacterium]